MLTVPSMYAKAERLFLRMNRVNTDLKNRLSCNQLDLCLRIGEEDVTVAAFNPDPLIELWFFDQVHHLKSGSRKSSKHVNTVTSSEGN